MTSRSALLVLLLLQALTAHAASLPIVRATMDPAVVNVGEAATLEITVLVPTWFSKPPVYPAFEIANAITELPPDSSYPTTARIGDETWSGIVRSYRVYPLLGATFRFSNNLMSVSYANPGGPALQAQVAVPDVALRARVPAGAEALNPYLAGSALTLDLAIEGDLDTLDPGDAVVLSYRAAVTGLPAIFLPPLAPPLAADGVSVYPDEPVLSVDGEAAVRTERITLVFSHGGEFVLPQRQLAWWNTRTRAVEIASTEQRTLSVSGTPPGAGELSSAGAASWRGPVFAGAAAVVLLIVLLRTLPLARQRYLELLDSYHRSERYAFRLLVNALNSGDGRKAYHALLLWLQRLSLGLDARGFARTMDDPALERLLTALSGSLYAKGTAAPDLGKLKAQLCAARKQFRSRRNQNIESLPGLNP